MGFLSRGLLKWCQYCLCCNTWICFCLMGLALIKFLPEIVLVRIMLISRLKMQANSYAALKPRVITVSTNIWNLLRRSTRFTRRRGTITRCLCQTRGMWVIFFFSLKIYIFNFSHYSWKLVRFSLWQLTDRTFKASTRAMQSTLSTPILPFYFIENIWKAEVFSCFQGDRESVYKKRI